MNFPRLLALLVLCLGPACATSPVPFHTTSSSDNLSLARQYEALEKVGFCLPQSLPLGVGYAGGDNESISAIVEGDGETVWYKGKTSDRNFTLGFSAEVLPQPSSVTRVAQGKATAMDQDFVIFRDADGLEASGLKCRTTGSGERDLHAYVFFAPGITLSEARQVMRSFAVRSGS